LIQTANISQKERKRRIKQDPYGWAQAQKRKSVNVKKQEVIQKAKNEAWGSPVHGITTPFVESFDSGGQASLSTPPVDEDGNQLEEPYALPTSKHIRNHLLDEGEVKEAIAQTYLLTKPEASADRASVDPILEEQERAEHQRHHSHAVEALNRITSLSNGSAKDRRHANIRRCVETFGRHVTDNSLERPTPPLARGVQPTPKPVRGGPDTGSSEVQIAILTAKIRALALELEGPKGHRDKNNKRSLAILCHKRQSLLRYLERKERGSGRWKHLIETLGLSPATWQKQITL
jgi:ribosomal protein S15